VKFKARPAAQLSPLVSLAIFAAGLAVLIVSTVKHRDRFDQVSMSEFYAWSSELRAGGDPWLSVHNPAYREIPGVRHLGHCNYPPAFLMAFEPLTMLPIKTAYWIWQAIIIASLVAATALVTRELGPPKAHYYALAVGGVLLYPEVYGMLYESQPTAILLLFVVAAFSLDRRRCSASAGLALAAAALLKMYPAMAGGYFLVRRRWPTLAWAAIFSVVGLALTGVHSIRDFAHFGIIGSSWLSTDTWLRNDRSIAILSNMRVPIDAIFGAAPPAAGIALWLGLTALADAAVVAAAFYLTYRAAAARSLDLASFGLWLAAAIVVSPIGWSHYLPFMIPLILVTLATIASAEDVNAAGAVLFLAGLTGTILPYYAGALRHVHMMFFATILAYIGAFVIVHVASRRGGAE
jgi:Glycosyltransferase family 87